MMASLECIEDLGDNLSKIIESEELKKVKFRIMDNLEGRRKRKYRQNSHECEEPKCDCFVQSRFRGKSCNKRYGPG